MPIKFDSISTFFKSMDCAQSFNQCPVLVSVVVPAYNAAAYLARTLNSVLSQTYVHLEVLLVDDGSSDSTIEVAQEFAAKDSRLIVLKQPNSGVAAARNFGIRQAKGQLIALIDADDIWYSQNLEKQVALMLQSGSSVGLVYSWSVDIDEHDFPTGSFRSPQIEGKVYTTLLLHNFIANASSTLLRRVCLEKVGFYDCTLRANQGEGCEDWDLYLRIAQEYEFRVVKEFLVGYRKTPSSMSCNLHSMARSRQLIWQSIEQDLPKMPQLIRKVSNSSFCMYLARQSQFSTDQEQAFYWLRQALQESTLATLLRPDFYGLYFKAHQNKRMRSKLQKNSHIQAPPHNLKHSKKKPEAASKSVQNAVSAKGMLEILIHRLASLFLGTPEKWR
ncbi:MAG: glycosyltransferase family 2 protein [Cyanobacteria bacterium Co-bin8]|nr:glycosyltransferase family 2 protein [Cyanobacteria bacterium Co-bin8]